MKIKFYGQSDFLFWGNKSVVSNMRRNSILLLFLFSGFILHAQNNPPVADDEVRSTFEDSQLFTANSAPGGLNNLLTGDTDLDGNPLTIIEFSVNGVTTAVASPFLITDVGTITINSNGSYSFAPVLNFNGQVPIITYTVSDGNGGTDTGTLTINVAAVNDTPVNIFVRSYTTPEDRTKLLDGISITDSDAGNGIITSTLSIPTDRGTLIANSVGNVTVISPNNQTLAISGTLADLNSYFANPVSQPIYTPPLDGNTNFCLGNFLLTFLTSDNGNSPGPARTTRTTVLINVGSVVDITGDNVGDVAVSTSKNFNVLTGTNGATPDSFEDPGRIVTAINGTSVTSGSIVPLTNGSSVTVNSNGDMSFTAGTTTGTETFTYTVTTPSGCAETATVTVNIIQDPMPVLLTSFSVKFVESKVTLLWLTTEEQNSSYFETQRSGDTKSWETIGNIQARGDAKLLSTYRFFDLEPLNGVNYYRLKMVDGDQSCAYSQIQSINIEQAKNVSLYPNPASNYLNVPDMEGKVVNVYDKRDVLHLRTKVINGQINTEKLLPGMYILKLEDLITVPSRKFLIIK